MFTGRVGRLCFGIRARKGENLLKAKCLNKSVSSSKQNKIISTVAAQSSACSGVLTGVQLGSGLISCLPMLLCPSPADQIGIPQKTKPQQYRCIPHANVHTTPKHERYVIAGRNPAKKMSPVNNMIVKLVLREKANNNAITHQDAPAPNAPRKKKKKTSDVTFLSPYQTTPEHCWKE